MAAPAVGQCGGAWSRWRDLSSLQRLRVGGYAGYLGLLTLLFIQPLTRLMLYAAQSDLHSHILLVPFITGYLLYLHRGRRSAAFACAWPSALVPSTACEAEESESRWGLESWGSQCSSRRGSR